MRRTRWLAAAAAILVVGGSAVAVAQRTRGGDDPTAAAAPARTDLDRCFDELAPSTGAPPAQLADGPIRNWPAGARRALALTTAGDLYVIDRSGAHAWTSDETGEVGGRGYLWAQWRTDGSILASRRVDGTDVRLERLTGPGRATEVTTLHGKVHAGAPKGYCPLDGYLATFAVTPSHTTLIHHVGGPIDHSCPAPDPGSSTNRWRCASPQAEGFELRTGDLTRKGKEGNEGVGGSATVAIVGSAAQSTNFLLRADRATELEVTSATPGPCCGAVMGWPAVLSPNGVGAVASRDGHRLTYTAGMDDEAGTTLAWRSPDRIDALARSGPDLLVAHGGSITVVRLPDGRGTNLTSLTGLPALRVLQVRP